MRGVATTVFILCPKGIDAKITTNTRLIQSDDGKTTSWFSNGSWKGRKMEATNTPEEKRLIEVWERHLRCEFADRDPGATVATMADHNYVNHVPVMTGGRGREEMLEFYGRHFIPRMPADTRITAFCRTIGQGRVVDEMLFAFTHDIVMDWMLPGVAPTGRTVEVALVVVVQIEGDEIVCERIYWDQASVLVQLGLLDPAGLPVAGVESARKAFDPSLPSNDLIRRAARERGGATHPPKR
jgi:carboxymethylenebutenolidase